MRPLTKPALPMRAPILAAALAAAGLLPDPSAADEPGITGSLDGFHDAIIQRVEHPDWFKDSFLDLPEDAQEARAAGKQGLFLFFGTEGCSYCHLFLATSLTDPDIVARLRDHFDSIGLEIFSDAELTDFSGDGTRVKQFALDQGVQFAPTLLFFDTDGNRLLRLTGYYEPERFSQALDYLIDGHYREQGLQAYLAGLQPPAAPGGSRPEALIPDPLFAAAPYALDRSRMPAERPLLVVFEGADCPRCKRFHDEVLGDAPTRARLADFDVVRLDAGDADTPVLTPAGERTNPRDWYAELGFSELPALAFFAEDGRPVLATDAVVLTGRMNNAIGFVTERAYEKGWTYQRYARQQGLARAAGRTP